MNQKNPIIVLIFKKPKIVECFESSNFDEIDWKFFQNVAFRI